MADAVATQIIIDGDRNVVQKFTNVSDGTGESAVVKVDVSGLATNSRGDACTGVTIERIWWQCIGMKVQIFWNASTNVFCIELGENQSGSHDYTVFGGLTNNSGSGKNGDVLFTTIGHTSADTYTIMMSMRKEYG